MTIQDLIEISELGISRAEERANAASERHQQACIDAARIPATPPSTTSARAMLEAIYLDWFNNYASPAVYGEHNGLTYEQAAALLDLARDVTNSPHPDA